MHNLQVKCFNEKGNSNNVYLFLMAYQLPCNTRTLSIKCSLDPLLLHDKVTTITLVLMHSLDHNAYYFLSRTVAYVTLCRTPRINNKHHKNFLDNEILTTGKLRMN